MTEYGVFTEEGCIEAQFSTLAAAEQAAADYREQGEDEAHAAQICPDHDEQPKQDCEECAVDGDTDVLEGQVIAHFGTTLGCEPDNADNPAVRAAHTALTDNGFTPVTVNDEFDPEPGDGTTGFYIEPRDTASGPCVYIHDALDGTLTWRRDANSKLNAYAQTLTAAGWSIESGTSKVIRAYPPAEPVQDAVAAELEQEPTDEPVNFDDVQVGDELLFSTRDNGFGGRGHGVDRTGVVTAKTAKTITVKVTGNNPFVDHVFRDGKARDLGYNARLLRSAWYDRSVRRTKKAKPTT